MIEAVVAVTPMESIKTFAFEKNLGLLAAVRGIVQSSGVGGLYKGVVPTIAKQVIMFISYGTLDQWLTGSAGIESRVAVHVL